MGFMKNLIIQMRKKTHVEEIDYTFVIDCMKEYRSPRAKITSLLRNEELIRVKKGLYLFGYDYRKTLYSPEIMANKIYGPSYVSLEYALAYYGLIPEHVAEVTSVSVKRTRNFDTPIGRFSYQHIPTELYRISFNLVQVRDNATALIASAEKALADLLYLRKIHVETLQELKELLFDDLRLDEALVDQMKIETFRELLKVGGTSTLKLLIDWIGRKK
jgi:hypothetical protein